MLSGRTIKVGFGDESATVSAVRRCLQGGVLSPLLSLFVANLIVKLSEDGFYVVTCADDLGKNAQRFLRKLII